MSQWPECDASLARAHKEGNKWNYCTVAHCDEVTTYNHDFCYCKGQFSVYPFVQNGVCMSSPGSLIPNAAGSCFCCCSCLAYDTPVAASKTEVRPVQDFEVGNPLLVATDASLKTWVQKPVKFSSGTGAKGMNKFIKVVFGDLSTGVMVKPESFVSRSVNTETSRTFYTILSTAPNNYIRKDGIVNLEMVLNSDPTIIATLLGVRIEIGERIYDILSLNPNFLLVTSTQPFLMKDKTLKQARKLIPGKDVLVLADGNTTPVVSLEVGMFNKGVHSIATSKEAAKSVDDHLMLGNGIVIGDYSAQIGLASGTIKHAYEDQPTFGTKEYVAKYTHLNATCFAAYAAPVKSNAPVSAEISHSSKSANIPVGAFSFVTELQAIELRDHAPLFPASNDLAEPGVRYLFRLFKGFYPDIVFYYDQNNLLPNAYSFELYGTRTVVLTIGWTMLDGIYFHGIAMTLAHVVNALVNRKFVPVDASPVGKADYEVFPSFLSLFYFAPDAVANYNLAFDQIKTIFGYIKENRHPHGVISLDCRIKTLEAGIMGYPLPHCAGGPPDPALEIVEVTATRPEDADHDIVSITFNLPVDPATATILGNYLFDPGVIAFSVSVDDTDPARVGIVADVEPDVEYLVVVTGVLSVDHQPVVVGKNSAKFKLS